MPTIAVLSGKGGTGKTFVSTNLAAVIHQNLQKIQLLDCDVEEPNSHLFFHFRSETEKDVLKYIPVVDQSLCTHCGKCSEVCQFSAIQAFKKATIVMDTLCHGCGACSYVCPEKAITEETKRIGGIQTGRTDSGFNFGMGLLNIGEPSGVQVIRELKKEMIDDMEWVILDSPPGASCPVVETLKDADYALLVTESTPFGLHDLQMVYEVLSEMNIPAGVVINRYDERYTELKKFLEENSLPVLLEIPFERKISEIYSKGGLIIEESEKWNNEFIRLSQNILNEFNGSQS